MKMRSSLPVAKSQSLSVLSQLAESAVRPSGAMATLLNVSECPVRVQKLLPGGQVPEHERFVGSFPRVRFGCPWQCQR